MGRPATEDGFEVIAKERINMRRVLRLAVGLLALGLLQQSANAAFSDILSVTSPGGGVVDQIAITDADEVANPLNVWKMDSGIANPLAWGQATVLVHPGSPNYWSDIFGVARDPANPANVFLAFMSDIDPTPLNGNPQTMAIAMAWFGQPVNFVPELSPATVGYPATQYLTPNLIAAGYTATFWSDVEVPEPTTMLAGALLLLPFGLSTLRIFRKRA